MKVAFINPKGTLFSKNPELSQFLRNTTAMDSFRHFWSAPCLGLLAIAAYLPEDWEAVYIDENYRAINFEESFDFVCISAMTVQAERAYALAEVYRRKNLLTVIGGIHATILPEEAGKHFDVVLAGEGEVVFPAFIQDYLKGKVKKIYKETQPGKFDLRRCIVPRYDLLKGYEYPVINLYTTRGCPRKCSFCCASNVYGTKYRRKTNEQIICEIDMISARFPDKMILFADDNLFVLRQQSRQLLKLMLSKHIRWIAQTDISIADDEDLLKRMYQAGCQWVVIGFESVSEKSLKQVESRDFKNRYIHSYSEKIKKIQSAGIRVYGTFIVGLDEDEGRIFDDTADFILENHLYGANITVPTPLPGTALRQGLESENRIRSRNWADYTLWDVVIQPKKITAAELENGLLHVYKRINEKNRADERLRYIFQEMKRGLYGDRDRKKYNSYI